MQMCECRETTAVPKQKWEKREELSIHGELIGMRREPSQPCSLCWTQRALAVSQTLMFQLRSS